MPDSRLFQELFGSATKIISDFNSKKDLDIVSEDLEAFFNRVDSIADSNMLSATQMQALSDVIQKVRLAATTRASEIKEDMNRLEFVRGRLASS